MNKLPIDNVSERLVASYYVVCYDELLTFVSTRLHGNRCEAEDIVQNVFLRLLTCGRMITQQTLPALVYTMARNMIVDFYRHHSSHEEFEHYIRYSSEATASTDSIVSAHELTELMERGLARVPENCREVYRMHIYGGMKVGEISLQLGEGYKSVEHRLGTARKAVRHFLKRYA